MVTIAQSAPINNNNNNKLQVFTKGSYSAIEVLKVAVNVVKYFVRPVAASASAVGGDFPWTPLQLTAINQSINQCFISTSVHTKVILDTHREEEKKSHFTVKPGATTIHKDSAAYVVSTSRLTMETEAVTHALRWTASRGDSQTTHAIILTVSMSLLRKVESGMGSPDCHVSMLNIHLRKSSLLNWTELNRLNWTAMKSTMGKDMADSAQSNFGGDFPQIQLQLTAIKSTTGKDMVCGNDFPQTHLQQTAMKSTTGKDMGGSTQRDTSRELLK